MPDVIQGYLFDKPNTAQNIEKTYIDSQTPEYQQRLSFIQKIYEFKEKMGVVHFDPKDILRENGVGLWVMRIKEADKHYEFHVDAIMEQVMAVDVKYTPAECYDYWSSKIHPDYVDEVQNSLNKMIRTEKAVQIEFPWMHPNLGNVMVRMSGKRVNNSDGMTVLEGYCRIITDVAGA